MAWNYPDGCGPDDYERWFGPDPEDEEDKDDFDPYPEYDNRDHFERAQWFGERAKRPEPIYDKTLEDFYAINDDEIPF